MKHLLPILLLTVLWGGLAKAQNLTFITHNLRGDDPNDIGNLWADRKLMIVSEIEKYKPDIYACEETKPEMAAWLIDTLTRFDTIGFVPNMGVGILYNKNRVSLQDHGYFYLSATPDVPGKGWDAKFARMCVWGKFTDLVTDQNFYAFATHFDHVGTVARTNSVTLILQKINDIAGTTPTILLGDFNFTQYDANYTTLNNSTLLKDTRNLAEIEHEKERGSGNGFNINRRQRIIVDFLWATQTWKTYSTDILLDLYNQHTSSDHYAAMAVVGPKANEFGELYRQFPEDFENPNPVKTSYTTGDVIYRTGTWTLNGALTGGSASNDQNTSGQYGVRMATNNTTSAYLQMNFDVTEGASRVTIQHSTYDIDTLSKWQLEYSTNQGLTWKTTGPVITTNQLNKQKATFVMDIPGNVRFRINKLGIGATNNGRLCVDDFTIYKRKNTPSPKPNEPLLAWQFASPARTGTETSITSSLTNGAVNSSTLTRGSGFRTTTASSTPISVPNGFGAAATIASSLWASDTTISINNDLYFQFTVKPKASQRISLSTIDVKLLSTGTGLKLWYWKYSLDGVNFKFLSKSYLFNANRSTGQATIDLSAYPQLQHLGSDKTVYFRLYVGGLDNDTNLAAIGTSTSGTANDHALTVNGIVEESTNTTPLAAWQFYSPTGAGNEATRAASIADNSVTVGPLTRGAGLTTVALSRTFASSTTTYSDTTIADTTTAIANNMYFGYKLKVKPNNSVSLSSLDYKIRISTGGAKIWYWKYSLDSVNYKKLAEPLKLTAATDNEGDVQPQLNLSAIPELQNVPAGKTIFFRLYTNGSNTSTGTSSIGRSGSATDHALSVNGVARTVPIATPLAAWQFATPLAAGGEVTANASLIDPALTVGSLQRGAGLKNTVNGGSTPYVLHRTFVAQTEIATTTAVTDTVKAIANNMYFTFNVTVKPNYKVSLSNLSYKLRTTTGGARVFYWKYSLDGTNWEKVANPTVLSAATSDEGDVQPSLDLSGIRVLQGLAAGKNVQFRLYTNGSNITTGTTAIGRSATSTSTDYVLTLSGNAEAITPPAKLVAWQLATPAKAGNEASVNATTVNAAITSTALVRGAGLNPTGLARAFAALTTAASSANLADTTIAMANNMYFGFSLTPQTGQQVSLDGLDLKIRATGGGAKVYYWKYSLNGTNFYKIEEPFTLAVAANTEGEFMPHVDLSRIGQLQNVPAGTTITFRLYTNGSNTTTGSTAIGRSTASTTEDILYISGKAESVGSVMMMKNAEMKPVAETKIISFQAKLNHKHVLLNWNAVNEKPDSRFEILRSENDRSPVFIGQVRTDTTGGQTRTYDYIDFKPFTGTNSYQIKTLDRNNNEVRSTNVNVTVKEDLNDLSLSGRENQLTVFVFSENACEGEFYFRDMMGSVLIRKKIRLEKGKNTFNEYIRVRPGVYTGTMVFGGVDVITKKVPF